MALEKRIFRWMAPAYAAGAVLLVACGTCLAYLHAVSLESGYLQERVQLTANAILNAPAAAGRLPASLGSAGAQSFRLPSVDTGARRIEVVIGHRSDANTLSIDRIWSDAYSIGPIRLSLEDTRPEALIRALEGDAGVMIGRDYLGSRVLAAYAPISGLKYGLVAKTSISELRRPYWMAGLGFSAVAAALSLFGTGLAARRARPVLQTLQQSEVHHRSIIESMDESVIVIDEGGIIQSLNPAVARLFGYSESELLGRDLTCLMPEPYRSRHASFVARYLGTGEKRIIGIGREVPGLHRDGTEIPLQLFVGEMLLDGKRLFAGIMHDISKRKEAQKEAAEAQMRAEQVTASKARMLASLSHEIRTPMNGILGMLELLSRGSLEPWQKSYVQLAQQSAKSLVSLINDVLNLAKLESGRVELDPEPVDLHDLVGEATAVAAALARDKHLRVKSHIAPEMPRKIMADPARLRQVLLNLLGNAVKFTERGAVDLRVERGLYGDGVVETCFSVEDTGIGIAPAAMDRLFEPFAQADASITRRYGGTGLGLAITRQLVDLMDGEIEVESEVGRGSVFRVKAVFGQVEEDAALERSRPGRDFRGQEVALDALSEVEATPPGEALTPVRPGHERNRILLAEDNPINQRVCQEMLELLGYSVTLATDGEQAVAQWASGRFGLVLMDCQMPNVDGFAATGRIRDCERYGGRGRTPIIAMTANAMDGDREDCLAAGMDDYISKPFRLTDLRRVLEFWLQDKPTAREGTRH